MAILNNNLRKSKRRLATVDGTLFDLKEELPILFKAFHLAVADYEKEIVLTPVQARARGFEASLLNSKVLNRIQEAFPINWKFGKYKRFILRVNGYNFLVKKLNGKDMPMNILTKNCEAINNQMTIPLFDSQDVVEPIVYFGYKKGRLGNIVDPKLVYIDENEVSWTMTEDMLEQSAIIIPTHTMATSTTPIAEPKLKEHVSPKKKTS